MDSEGLITQANRLIDQLEKVLGQPDDPRIFNTAFIQTKEFFRVYTPPGSIFYQDVNHLGNGYRDSDTQKAIGILEAFIQYTQAGLNQAISPERQAQLDVVSDFLEQANSLLHKKDVHPAAPAVLIGATLEEFLRTWAEAEGIALGSKKPSLDTYAKLLRENNLITKQDMKDITAWGGVRNHAAHGEWDQVNDRQRITLMLEGVNLFMRRYIPGS